MSLSFIETQFPVSRLSKESYKERKANYSQTLTHLSHGHTYAHIAREMDISIHTVRCYIRRSYEKLQVHSRTEAVAKFRGH
jgi:DNA-binding NarL/FixJ family response regulator